MDERVTVPLTEAQAAWLRREAERQQRPVAFIARKAIDREMRREAAQGQEAA